MVKKSILFAILLSGFSAVAQTRKPLTERQRLEIVKKEIVTEGTLLYRREMAALIGGQIFWGTTYKDQSFVGGYITYIKNDSTRCVFYSSGDKPRVIGTFILDKQSSPETVVRSMVERDLSPAEKELYTLRKLTEHAMQTDTVFRYFSNVEYHLIPVIAGGKRKVYMLTKPLDRGTMMLGNDYLLTFSAKNQLTDWKQLHKHINTIKFTKGNMLDTGFTGGAHSHIDEPDQLITATDICTLMMYSINPYWKQHYVISARYVNVWDFEKKELLIYTREEWERLYGN
ncbi:hypothetical protein SAMN05428949_5650 [Chitinophaga sp. YR627]|uniref:hypothetical protein n=1 Tax=Chitinophaga sp. YR627 TaxID=1881041 RepID=UPI0008DEBB8D|nr:hypothetical protein [Chitinophaga sp. YR627]SFO53962.1 hypothetical protein SAMN05428949_5650 [Chitinophaga sp. YR627]